MKKIAWMLIIGLAALIGQGCGKHTLAPDGAYKGNYGLYVQDDAITTANDGLHRFLTWEWQTRSLLPVKVSQYADYVRTNRAEWNAKAIRLRDAYALVPSEENGAAFKAALNELQQALVEATVIMTANKGAK